MAEQRRAAITRVWQWNCRGYCNKRGALAQYIAGLDKPPHIIALQETGAETPSLSGYKALVPRICQRVAVLAANHVNARKHELIDESIDHVLIEIIPEKRQYEDFSKLHARALKLTQNQLLIIGDFNAPHSAGGYTRSMAKSTRLYHSIRQQRLSILTVRSSPRERATVCGRWSEWSNLEVNLGSDHAIAQVDIAVSPGKKFLRKQALTDWDRFRAARTATHSEREHDDASLASWTERLVCDKNTYMETINLTTETPEVDRHQLHLWEARHGLIKRWKRQKLNRKLKKRIAAITAEALEYAAQLARSNWNKKCTDLQGNLGTKDAWQFLRHLLDPSKSKRNTSQNLQKIVRDFPGTNQDLLEQLKLRYIGSFSDEEYHDYVGEPNPELDVPFSFEEVWSALQDLGRNTAPGEDRVQNTLLRNLDAGSVQTLLEHINQVW
ncbi:hypothetical protein HPB47_007395 [Ixodes persulcatus]|uniref:Uncharacterized protein n=1 Tax=Ixodes persulcatus TaxID=34615 RepID=A0AC60P7M5_IXOPE|nr:hypothetical protein HPB47_007395 [Ixodes persulcatus]